MGEMMKLCKDCRHYRFQPSRALFPMPWWIEHVCARATSPVTGKEVVLDANKERESGNCGALGAFWELKG